MIAGRPPAGPVRLWVTRPEDDAEAFADALRVHGFDVLVAPLLRVVFAAGPPLDLSSVQALLVTSANGARAFAARNPERMLPLLAVGDASARAARDLGFGRVSSAGGDVAALADLVCRTLDPAAGALLHPAASAVAGDLGGALRAAGFAYRREVMYEARPAEVLPSSARMALQDGQLDAVAVFSPRTGRTLVRLITAAGLAPRMERVGCVCLSAAVAEAVSGLPWRQVIVAPQPNQPALIDSVRTALQGPLSDSRMDSASSTGYFTATLETTSNRPTAGDGGMSSETNKDQQQGADTPPRVLPSPAAEPEPAHVGTAPIASGPTSGMAPAEDTATREAQTSWPWGEGPRESPAGTTSAAAAPPETGAPEEGSPGAGSPGAGSPGAGSPGAGTPRSGTAGAGTPGAEAPASRGSRSLLWALVALLVLAAAGAAAWYGYFLPRQQQQMADAGPADAQTAGHQPAPVQTAAETARSDPEAQYARLRQQLDSMTPRLDALERTVATLRQSVDALGAAPQQPGVDESELQALSERTARLESQTAAAASLAQQVRSLEASTAMARDTASKLATTVLAVGQLAQAVDAGEPFVRELAGVRALGGDDPEIAQAVADLQKWSSAGVPTLALLSADFPKTAEAVARAEPVTAGDNWTDRIVDRLASLVSIRRTGDEAIAAGGVDGALATTALALEHGDLQGAVKTLEGLDSAPRQAAEDWLSKARTRIEADRMLASLQQRAIARLSSAKG